MAELLILVGKITFCTQKDEFFYQVYGYYDDEAIKTGKRQTNRRSISENTSPVYNKKMASQFQLRKKVTFVRHIGHAYPIK